MTSFPTQFSLFSSYGQGYLPCVYVFYLCEFVSLSQHFLFDFFVIHVIRCSFCRNHSYAASSFCCNCYEIPGLASIHQNELTRGGGGGALFFVWMEISFFASTDLILKNFFACAIFHAMLMLLRHSLDTKYLN